MKREGKQDGDTPHRSPPKPSYALTSCGARCAKCTHFLRRSLHRTRSLPERSLHHTHSLPDRSLHSSHSPSTDAAHMHSLLAALALLELPEVDLEHLALQLRYALRSKGRPLCPAPTDKPDQGPTVNLSDIPRGARASRQPLHPLVALLRHNDCANQCP